MIKKQILQYSEFIFKDGHSEFAAILSETPNAYFVQFNDKLSGMIYKNELQQSYLDNGNVAINVNTLYIKNLL